MNKLLASALVSVAAVGLSASQASAGWLSWLCCGGKCSYKYTVNCRPYNAFTPVCYGNVTCDGACIPGMPGMPPPPGSHFGMGSWGHSLHGAECCQGDFGGHPQLAGQFPSDGSVITGTPVIAQPATINPPPAQTVPVNTPPAGPASARPMPPGVLVQPTAHQGGYYGNMGYYPAPGAYPVPMQHPGNAWYGNMAR
jgi:hypothetical protein